MKESIKASNQKNLDSLLFKYGQSQDNSSLCYFYSILELAILSGYIIEPLPRWLKDQVINFSAESQFENNSNKDCQHILFSMLLEAVQQERYQQQTGTPAMFLQLLLLETETNGDTKTFLDLLQNNNKRGFSLNKFKQILNQPAAVQEIISQHNASRTIEKEIFEGMLQYASYLDKFGSWIKEHPENKKFTAAAWHLHGDWFSKMTDSLNSTYFVCLELLCQSAITTARSNKLQHDDNVDKEVEELLEENERLINKIKYTTSPDRGRPLRPPKIYPFLRRRGWQLVAALGLASLYSLSWLNSKQHHIQMATAEKNARKADSITNSLRQDLLFYWEKTKPPDENYLTAYYSDSLQHTHKLLQISEAKRDLLTLQLKTAQEELFRHTKPGALDWHTYLKFFEDTLKVGQKISVFHFTGLTSSYSINEYRVDDVIYSFEVGNCFIAINADLDRQKVLSSKLSILYLSRSQPNSILQSGVPNFRDDYMMESSFVKDTIGKMNSSNVLARIIIHYKSTNKNLPVQITLNALVRTGSQENPFELEGELIWNKPFAFMIRGDSTVINY